MPNPLSAPLIAWLSRLSFPRLFVVVGVLFSVNLLLPDPILLLDEVLLGVTTMILAKWKRAPKPERAASGPPPIDGKARRP